MTSDYAEEKDAEHQLYLIESLKVVTRELLLTNPSLSKGLRSVQLVQTPSDIVKIDQSRSDFIGEPFCDFKNSEEVGNALNYWLKPVISGARVSPAASSQHGTITRSLNLVLDAAKRINSDGSLSDFIDHIQNLYKTVESLAEKSSPVQKKNNLDSLSLEKYKVTKNCIYVYTYPSHLKLKELKDLLKEHVLVVKNIIFHFQKQNQAYK